MDVIKAMEKIKVAEEKLKLRVKKVQEKCVHDFNGHEQCPICRVWQRTVCKHPSATWKTCIEHDYPEYHDNSYYRCDVCGAAVTNNYTTGAWK